jgi:hypothetical protein
MKEIVVEVRKGMVTGLYCDIEDAKFVVVDWDLLECADSGGQVAIEHDYTSLTALPLDTRTEYRRVF